MSDKLHWAQPRIPQRSFLFLLTKHFLLLLLVLHLLQAGFQLAEYLKDSSFQKDRSSDILGAQILVILLCTTELCALFGLVFVVKESYCLCLILAVLELFGFAAFLPAVNQEYNAVSVAFCGLIALMAFIFSQLISKAALGAEFSGRPGPPVRGHQGAYSASPSLMGSNAYPSSHRSYSSLTATGQHPPPGGGYASCYGGRPTPAPRLTRGQRLPLPPPPPPPQPMFRQQPYLIPYY